MVGSIVTRDEHTHHVIEIDFHDTSKHRNLRFQDHFEYSMAALGEYAALCFVMLNQVRYVL